MTAGPLTIFVCGCRGDEPSAAMDLRAIRALIARDTDLTDWERNAFHGMLVQLERRVIEAMGQSVPGFRGHTAHDQGLTSPQRAAVLAALKRLDIDVLSQAERNANVPRGREVDTPEVLRHLPKRPPGRRS